MQKLLNASIVAGLAIALTLSPACSSEPAAAAPEALFGATSINELNGSAFLDSPFPSDARRAGGFIALSGLYNPRGNALVKSYLAAIDGKLAGFSPTAPAYLRFSASLDLQSLPTDAAAATNPASSVQLIDIDPKSPERGKRMPIDVFYRDTEGTFWLPHTLAVMPMPGAPLRPNTRYALVATRALRGAGAQPSKPSSVLEQVLGLREGGMPANLQSAYADAVSALAGVGIAASNVAHLSIYTTGDPTAELRAIADALPQQVPAPQLEGAGLVRKENLANATIYEGSYGPTPNYQAGEVPFTQAGGEFEFVSGIPKLQNTFSVRFALSIPKPPQCPMPAEGYPIVVYAHGTGGNYRSFVGDRTAQRMAEQCLASMGTDQIFHGTRPGAPAPNDPQAEQKIQTNFFNLANPAAARTNGRQSAVDVMQQARLLRETRLEVSAALSASGTRVLLDPDRVLFFGHSQGGLNGPLYLALDSSSLGGVLSGSGSMLSIALLEKKQPVIDVSNIVRLLLGLSTPEDIAELNIFHPIIGLAQAIVDTTDPINYMRLIAREPRSGFAPKSILMTQGIRADGSGDNYAPPYGIEVGAAALGLPRLAPGVRPVRALGVLGIADIAPDANGMSGNLAGGKASGAIAQFAPDARDGHFVVFDVPSAATLTAKFLRDLADNPRGKLRAIP